MPFFGKKASAAPPPPSRDFGSRTTNQPQAITVSGAPIPFLNQDDYVDPAEDALNQPDYVDPDAGEIEDVPDSAAAMAASIKDQAHQSSRPPVKGLDRDGYSFPYDEKAAGNSEHEIDDGPQESYEDPWAAKEDEGGEESYEDPWAATAATGEKKAGYEHPWENGLPTASSALNTSYVSPQDAGAATIPSYEPEAGDDGEDGYQDPWASVPMSQQPPAHQPSAPVQKKVIPSSIPAAVPPLRQQAPASISSRAPPSVNPSSSVAAGQRLAPSTTPPQGKVSPVGSATGMAAVTHRMSQASLTSVSQPSSAPPTPPLAGPPGSKKGYNELVNGVTPISHPAAPAAAVPENLQRLDAHRRALERQEWFHGKLDRVGAEAILRPRDHGAYLVREGGDGFTLSFKNNQELNHMKIKYENETYILGARSRPFESIMEMLLYYTTHELQIRGSTNTTLGKPVPRR